MSSPVKNGVQCLLVPVCEAHPGWIDLYQAAWRIAASNVTAPAVPGWKPQMCCLPGAPNIWLWDSCFMTFFARYGDGIVPVMNNLDNLYRLQREDGFLSMAYAMESGKPAYGERINPPLLAWAELNYWKFSGDEGRLRDVLPRLVSFFDWIKANRRRKSGLYWFEDSGSTGMDNSPRSGYLSEHLNGSDICHVDLAAQQALSAECISTMARHLGEAALADRFYAEHRAIVEVLNRYHWDSQTGFYYDVFNRDEPTERHNFVNHKTVAAFWPLMAGCCCTEQRESLLKHLLNPEEFWTKHPVASLSKDDPNFDPAGAYWLGGVWAPINYMIAKALRREGRPDLARQLAVSHLEAMSAVFQSREYSGIWEAYAPEAFLPATHKPSINFTDQSPFILSAETIVRPNVVGWSGLGPIAMLIEDILGFDFDAPANRITWDIRTRGLHGIKDFPFQGGRISLIASDQGASGNGVQISAINERDVTLVLLVNGTPQSERLLQAGTHSFPL